MKHVLPIAAVAFALGFAGAANAVDVVNEDQFQNQVVIGDGEDLNAYLVNSGETLRNVCDSCVMQIGGHDPVKASGKQVVVISGGKVEIKSTN